jgi:hypothetical protein
MGGLTRVGSSSHRTRFDIGQGKIYIYLFTKLFISPINGRLAAEGT